MTGFFRRTVGLDFVDLAIHAGVTFFLMILADEAARNGAGVGIVGAVSSGPGRRHYALEPPRIPGRAERGQDGGAGVPTGGGDLEFRCRS
jgi:hypothetical protein